PAGIETRHRGLLTQPRQPEMGEHRVFAAEMVEEGLPADADLGNDAGDGGLVEALGAEQPAAHVENAGPEGRFPVFAQRHGLILTESNLWIKSILLDRSRGPGRRACPRS